MMDPQVKSSIAVGQTYQLQQLIFKGVDVNARDVQSNTPLILAAKQGCLPIFQLLHRAGANPELCDKRDHSPIHYASKCGHTDIVRYLVACLPKKSCDLADGSGHTPMMLAAEAGYTEISKLLIKHVQVDLNSFNDKRQTALHLATYEGQTSVIQLLIRSGATIDRRDDHDWMKGETPLMYAAKTNKKQIVKLLLHAGADTTKLNKCGHAALTLAAAEGHLDVVKELIRVRSHGHKSPHSKYKVLSTLGDSPLVAAAENGRLEVVQFLLKAHVTRYLNVAVINATLRGHVDIVRLIIDYLPSMTFHQSDDVFLVPKMHQDVFLLAVTHNHEEIVRYLIEKNKVDVNGWSPMGRTALHEAVNAGHTMIAKLLIANGARMNSRDKLSDLTPLLVACYMGNADIVRLILGSAERSTSQFKELISARDMRSNSVLHYAVMKGHVEIVRILLSHGVNPQLIDSKLQTPMHLAVQVGSERVLKWLLDAGAVLSRCNHDGNTPLHVAASADALDLVWFILDQPRMENTYRTRNNINGLTTIQIATLYARIRVCHLLMEHDDHAQSELHELLTANDRTLSLTQAVREVAEGLVYQPLWLSSLCVCTIRASISTYQKSQAAQRLPLPRTLRNHVALLHYRESNGIVCEDRL